MSERALPLFPLHTVLFPGGQLPLRVFEPRYLKMVCACLKEGSEFGICLIRSGQEVGRAAQTYPVGTLARIADWDRGPDGLLAITCRGGQRFRIRSVRVEPDQLTVARVVVLPPDPEEFVPAHLQGLAGLLERILDRIEPPEAGDDERPLEDAGWVGARLAELLPLPAAEKQELLELTDPIERLERLQESARGLRFP